MKKMGYLIIPKIGAQRKFFFKYLFKIASLNVKLLKCNVNIIKQ